MFQLKLLVFRFWMLCMKVATFILPFRQPELSTGAGSSLELCGAIAKDGHKTVLIVTDAMLVELGLIKPMQDKLTELGVTSVVYDGVKPDPTIAQIEAGVAQYKQQGCEAILAVGGGSSIDAAKIIAARAKPSLSIRKMAGLFRVVLGIKPLYAVPTTAGTGSEVTIAAVVSDPERTKKMSIIDLKLVPQKAALDGALMTGLPAPITAATGMDALTHAVEAYISKNANKKTDEHAIAATKLIFENLPTAFHDGGNLQAREQMALASYKAGVAFTIAGVGYVHAISHNLGAHYHVPHGLANAIVLPYILDFSKPNCVGRLAELARAVGLEGGSDTELAEAFIARIRAMNAEMGIPTVVEKLQKQDIPQIRKAAQWEAFTTYAVPRYLTDDQAEGLIAQMLPA